MNVHGNTVLVVVDFQGGELSADSPYSFEQRDKAAAIVAACRQSEVPVVWIQEVHKPHLTDIGRELDGSEGPHCIEGDPATEIAHGLGPVGEEFHIRKRRYSSFFATELDIVLKSYRADSLLLIGGFTDVCILYTSVDAHQRDLHVNVVTDVVAGSSQRAHDDALKMIQSMQRDSLVTSHDVLSWLSAEGGAA